MSTIHKIVDPRQSIVGWTEVEHLKESVLVAGMQMHLEAYAYKRHSDGMVVTGSSAASRLDGTSAAHFEVLERIACVDALAQGPAQMWPKRDLVSGTQLGFIAGRDLFPESKEPELYQYAKSNGVAIGSTFAMACKNACYELIERHMVLASWYGAILPQQLELVPGLDGARRTSNYEKELYSFGKFENLLNGKMIDVVGCFFWPHSDSLPLAYGFGAAESTELAIEKSSGEALQRLAFLQDIDAVELETKLTPTPDFHQDYYLHPSRFSVLKGWLTGSFYYSECQYRIPMSGMPEAVDLTPKNNFPGHVVKAIMQGCLPLVFGNFQPPQWPILKESQRIHPIV